MGLEHPNATMSFLLYLLASVIYWTGVNVIKLFTAVSYEFSLLSINKLECLSLPSLSSLVYCLLAKPGVYPIVEHLKGSVKVL
jgi:hypothetical protein